MKIIRNILILTIGFFSIFIIIRKVNNAPPLKLSNIIEIIENTPVTNPLTTFTELIDGWDEIVENNIFYDIIDIILLGGLSVTKVLTAFVTMVFTFIYDMYLYIVWLAPYLIGIN